MFKVKNGHDEWTINIKKGLVEAKGANKKNICNGVVKNGFIHWDNTFAVPHIVREAMDKAALNGEIEEEVTTTDLAVPENIITAKKPKDYIDVYENKNEENVVVTSKRFAESVKDIFDKKYYMLSENFGSAKKNYDFVVECEGYKHRVLIPKTSFDVFLKENAIVKNFVDERGNLLTEKMMSTRNMNVKAMYLKEFIDNETGMYYTDDLKVLSITQSKDTDSFNIECSVNDEYLKVFTVPDYKLIKYVLDNDVNAKKHVINFGEQSLFDEKSYFDNEKSAKNIILNFLNEQ